jgi:Transposase
MFRAFLLNEELKLLYALEDPALAPAHLNAWLGWATRSRLAPFVKLACTIRRHRSGILAPIQLELSNGRLNGLNSRIRLISHRSFGLSRARVQPSETLVVERKQVVAAELVRRSRLVQRGMPRRPFGPAGDLLCRRDRVGGARLLRQELVGPQRTKVQDRYPLLSTSHLIPHRRLS